MLVVVTVSVIVVAVIAGVVVVTAVCWRRVFNHGPTRQDPFQLLDRQIARQFEGLQDLFLVVLVDA